MGACSGVQIRRFAPSQEEEGPPHGSTSGHHLDAHFVSGRLTIRARVIEAAGSVLSTVRTETIR